MRTVCVQVHVERKLLGAWLEEEEANPRLVRENGPPNIAHSRLTPQRCRALLGGAPDLTDAQVLKLRDSLYDLANVALDARRSGYGSSNSQM
jgi:hypothetical protein